MADYPFWYCSIYACDFRTSYSHNIRKHLSEVHGWDSENIRISLDNFFEAKQKGWSVVCNKSEHDPCYPRSALLLGSQPEAGVSLSFKKIPEGVAKE